MAETNNFEWFDPTEGSPVVSFAEYGITFSKNTVKIMKFPNYVRIGYDLKKNIVAVQECFKDDENSIFFTRRDNPRYVRLNVGVFIRLINPANNYKFKKAKKYVGVWDEENKLLTIDLNSVEFRGKNSNE